MYNGCWQKISPAGLDPEKVALYCQSHVHETAELYLYLNMLAYKGELEKTATFKEKARQHPENVNAGLLTYPVLQAADIIIAPGINCSGRKGPGTAS